jgi:hypothetical protein
MVVPVIAWPLTRGRKSAESPLEILKSRLAKGESAKEHDGAPAMLEWAGNAPRRLGGRLLEAVACSRRSRLSRRSPPPRKYSAHPIIRRTRVGYAGGNAVR